MISRRDERLTVKLGADTVGLYVRRWMPAAPNGCTLLCVHGLTTNGSDFAFLANHLAHHGYTVVAPDLVGHGRSTYLRRESAYNTGLIARCLNAITSRYSRGANAQAFIGSSWGAAILCLFLAASHLKAAAVIMTDFPMEWRPQFARRSQFFAPGGNFKFDTLADAKQHLIDRDKEVMNHRDTHEIAPAVLDRFRASRIMMADGKYALAFDPCVLASLGAAASHGARYPDFYRIISMIDSPHVLLLSGEHSKYRISSVRDRLVANRANVTAVDVEGAGHSPRLLTRRQAQLVQDFLDKARAG